MPRKRDDAATDAINRIEREADKGSKNFEAGLERIEREIHKGVREVTGEKPKPRSRPKRER